MGSNMVKKKTKNQDKLQETIDILSYFYDDVILPGRHYLRALFVL